MKFFRVGSCLALLMAGAACTQAPQSVTAPSAAVGGSTAATAAADGSTLKVTAPALVSPVDGARAEDRRPTLIWLNSTGNYGGIGVAYDIELSTPTAVVYSRTVGESPDIGAHLIDFELDYDIVYSWRVRAHLGDPERSGRGRAGRASCRRRVPSRPRRRPAARWQPAAAPRRCRQWAPAKRASRVRTTRPSSRGVAGAFPGCAPQFLPGTWRHRGSSWTAPSMRCAPNDGRYGYNAKRGNMNDPSLDVVSYFYGQTPTTSRAARGLHLRHHRRPLRRRSVVVWIDVTDITFTAPAPSAARCIRGRAATSRPRACAPVSLHDPGPAWSGSGLSATTP